jgi:23S rRNA 5-hydroxycytidine C2501 synthase
LNKVSSIKKIELLSPARDLECGIAAINCGADAVYIGAPRYGARAAVGNSLKDIEALVNYSHKFWAKVYVTVNTIIYDNELDDVQGLIHQLYNIGVDAIIIQDLGILEMDLPPIPIIASTQTNNYSLDKIKFFEEIGLHRVILARELSLTKINEIRKSTNIELEFFIHGALCVCYSGQCYFSFATTGRSANRGECSQPCRMLYSLEDLDGKVIVKDKYLLSLKDLNLSNYLSQLIEAGISSFKIEGRLKDINYVKNITAYYRQKLDEIFLMNKSFKKSSSGQSIISFKPDPEKTFNRGYTEHFINGEAENIASINTQKSIGQSIGTISKIGKDYFEINTNKKIVCGDGICFFDEKDELKGMSISKVERNRIYTRELKGLSIGSIIFRNHDHQFFKELSKDKSQRKINVQLSLKDEIDKIILTAKDEDENIVEGQFTFDKVIAKNPNQFLSTIEQQLKKSGDSIFIIRDVQVNFSQPYFFTVAKINEMRRQILKLLESERTKRYPRVLIKFNNNVVMFPRKKITYLDNVVNHKARKFYKKLGVEYFEDGFELLKAKKGKVILRSKYCVKAQLNICPLKNPGQQINMLNRTLYLSDKKRKFKLEFNCQECEMSIIF